MNKTWQTRYTYANHKSMLNHIAFLFRPSMNFNPPAMQQASCRMRMKIRRAFRAQYKVSFLKNNTSVHLPTDKETQCDWTWKGVYILYVIPKMAKLYVKV